MRLHFLPAEQARRDDRAAEKLRRVGYVLLFLVFATVALGAKIYLWPPAVPPGPQVLSEDGRTVYGDAILVRPDLVLCLGRTAEKAQLVSTEERISATKLSTASIDESTEMTLLRLDSPSSVPPLVPAVGDKNDRVTGSAGGQEWRGVITAVESGEYDVDPSLSLPVGAAVVRQSDSTALIGVTGQTKREMMIVPAKDVFAKFPELRDQH
jgi:hypothetical protein